MLKFTIDTGTWSQARFESLCKAIKVERTTGIGVLILLWARTRLGGMDVAGRDEIEDLIPVPRAMRAAWFDALVRQGYLQRLGKSGFLIEGNAAFFERIAKLRKAGRARQAQAAAMRQGIIPPRPKRPKAEPVLPQETADARAARNATWQSYRDAYIKRYQIKPVRNGRTNVEISHFVSQVGQTDAPTVMRFYVNHHGVEYLEHMHPVRLALRDAQSLAAQWCRGELVGAPRPIGCRSRPMRQTSLWQG